MLKFIILAFISQFYQKTQSCLKESLENEFWVPVDIPYQYINILAYITNSIKKFDKEMENEENLFSARNSITIQEELKIDTILTKEDNPIERNAIKNLNNEHEEKRELNESERNFKKEEIKDSQFDSKNIQNNENNLNPEKHEIIGNVSDFVKEDFQEKNLGSERNIEELNMKEVIDNLAINRGISIARKNEEKTIKIMKNEVIIKEKRFFLCSSASYLLKVIYDYLHLIEGFPNLAYETTGKLFEVFKVYYLFIIC